MPWQQVEHPFKQTFISGTKKILVGMISFSSVDMFLAKDLLHPMLRTQEYDGVHPGLSATSSLDQTKHAQESSFASGSVKGHVPLRQSSRPRLGKIL